MNIKACFSVWVPTWIAMTSSALATTLGTVTEQALWHKGDNGYNTYRIPALATAKNGTLLAFSEGRKNSTSDSGDIDLVLRRSSDGGATWGPQQVVWDDGANVCGNPAPLVDQTTGRIVLVATWNLGADSESAIINKTSADTRRVFVLQSDDSGATWSAPREITATAKLSAWGWYATGPGGGIQLRTGPHAGRLVVACDHTDAAGAYKSHVIFSDDAGATWQLGGEVPDVKLNECQVVELADGRLAVNMRNYDRTVKARRVSYSSDAGATWSAPVFDPVLIEPICQASIERVRLPAGEVPGVVAFLNPASETARVNLTLRLSFDETATWAQSRLLFAGPSAYSDLTMTSAGEIAALYECGSSSAYEEIRFARVALSETSATNTSAEPSSSSAVFEDGLQAWFCADEGVNQGTAMNGQGVTNWASSGQSQVTVVATNANTAPYYVAEAFQRADGSSAPAVRFNRNMADSSTVSGQPHGLLSTSNTTLKVSADSTWFIVYRLMANMSQTSFFGLNEATARFGGFFLGSPDTNKFRAHNSNSSSSMGIQLAARAPALLDSRRKGVNMEAQLDGVVTARITNASGTLTAASQFRIGAMLDGVPVRAVADVAEILIYNRAVNDAERVILQNALAARYGLSLAGLDAYAGGEGPRLGFCDRAVGIGKYTADLNPNGGTADVSASSGGLSLESLNGTLNAGGEFVMAGYRGATNYWLAADAQNMRLAREWYVQKTSGDGVDVRLKFSLADANVASPGAVTYRLFYRADRTQAFTVVNAAASVNGDAVSFNLGNADVPTGCYTLGVGTPWEAAAERPFLGQGLTTWFRADQGVEADPATQEIRTWESVHGSVSVATVPSLTTNAPVRVAHAFARAAGVYQPAVRFNWDGSSAIAGLPQVLKSRVATVLAVTNDNTCFVVGRTLGPQRNQGLFGLDQTTSRFGAFFLGTANSASTSRIRMHSFNAWQSLLARQEADVSTNAVFLVDARRNASTNGAAGICGSLNGSLMQAADWRPADITAPIAAPLYIGNQLVGDAVSNLVGDIAEIRVYNRALNDAERVTLQNHLAARYGLTLAASDFYRGKEAASGDYDLDVVGIGCAAVAGGGRVPGVVTQSEDSAGLRLIGLNGTLNADSEYLLAGRTGAALTRDGWTNAVSGETYVKRWQRDWYVGKTTTDGVDVRLAFDFATAGASQGGDSNYILLYRQSLANAFAAVPSQVAVTNGTQVSFDLRYDSLNEGYYTLGTGDASPVTVRDTLGQGAGVTAGLRAWFRASDAVAANGSTVTNWGNLGLIGTLLDVQLAAGAPQWVANGAQRATGVYEPVVRFDGNARLVSAAVSDLCVSQDVCWFAVFNPTGSSRSNRGLFGTDDVTTRFGGFFTGTAPHYPLRCNMFNINNAANQCEINAITQNVFQIADYSRQRLSSTYALSGRLNGAALTNRIAAQSAPVAGRLKIGNMLTDGALSNFLGDFAELRVYNRALNDVERAIVQNHLAARYGILLATNDLYAGKGAAAGDCDLDVVGIGRATNAATGFIPGTVVTSESSAGLTFAALNGTLAGDGEYLLAGHGVVSNQWIFCGASTTGATYRWKREWYLDKTSADGLEARLTFDFSAAGIGWRSAEDKAQYRLLRRANAAAMYADTEVAPTVSGDTLVFDLADSDLSDGLYTVGALTQARGTTVLVR
jgi:sialidase-1